MCNNPCSGRKLWRGFLWPEFIYILVLLCVRASRRNGCMQGWHDRSVHIRYPITYVREYAIRYTCLYAIVYAIIVRTYAIEASAS